MHYSNPQRRCQKIVSGENQVNDVEEKLEKVFQNTAVEKSQKDESDRYRGYPVGRLSSIPE